MGFHALTRLFSRHLTGVLAVSLFIGLAFPNLATLLRPLITPAVLLLLLATMLRIDWRQSLHYRRRPVLLSAVLGWMLIASPVLMWLALKWIDLPPGVEVALILMAASPPTLSSPSLAQIIGLDGALSLVVLCVAILVVPLTLPFLSIELLRLELSLGTLDLMLRLGGLIGGAFVAALVVRHLLGSERIERSSDIIDSALVLAMVVFAIAVMDGVAATFAADPGHVLMVAGIAFAANLGFQVLAWVVFSFTGRRTALTAGFSCGNRNMGILLPALPAAIWPDVFLFIAVFQFPIYMLPWVLVKVYGRLVKVD